MTSYIQLINKIDAFCSAHYQIKRFDAEFGEQRPNLATDSEEYPYVFMSPSSGTPNYDLNQITVEITCYDIIQKDRANLNTIVSDCHLILTDLFGYYNQGKDDDIIALSASQTPLNNYDLDYVAGWSMTITFELEGWCTDAIPMSPITPGASECADADVENSDASYTSTVVSGGSLTLPDSDVNVNSVNEGSVVSVKDIDIDVVDSSGSVTPDSVTIVGNTVTIDVPDSNPAPVGATLMSSGALTVYRTGDDASSSAVNRRATDFFTLANANPFGTTARFTDELGGSTYANDIYIDWSTYDNIAGTVLGYYFTGSSFSTWTWNDAIDNALSHTVGTFTTGWRLPNRKEFDNLVNDEATSGHKLDYAPFNFSTSISTWTSTTSQRITTTAYVFASRQAYIFIEYQKTNNRQTYFYARTFTVTGTTLT